MKTFIVAVLCLCAGLCSAQTNIRANNGSFTGNVSVSGTVNFKNLEAILFADQYGNGTTTGIAGAITAAGVTNKTNIWVPSSYATTEKVPGSIAQWKSGGPGSLASMGGNTVANLTFQDFRFGNYFSALDPKGDSSLINANYAAWFNFNSNYIAGPSGLSFNNHTLMGLNSNPMDGGFNFNNNGYSNKEAYANIDSRITSFTPGQKYGITSFNTNYSTGDQLGFFAQNACYGGFTASGDEGCEALDMEAIQGNVEYTATIASGASTGSTSLTLTPTAGSTTQGSHRFLVDITQISNAGTISAVTFTNGTTPVAITGSGTSFGTSTVNTTLGTAVTTPGTATVTPAAMTNITTATNLCIADPGAFEHVTPSSTTGTTFTATFRFAHPTTAIVAFGGVCGKYIELVADRVTTAVFGATAIVNTGGNVGAPGNVVNTLHLIVPMIRSTSNTAADIWLTNPNTGYAAYRGRWTSGGTNTYAIYPGAQVTSVQGAVSTCINNSTCGSGNIGNNFILEQNGVAWATNDVVALPPYFVQNVSLGQMYFGNFFPQAGTANIGALSITSYGISQLNDPGYLVFNNTTPAAIYTAGGGVLTPPTMMASQGPFQTIFRANTIPTSAFLADVEVTNQTNIYKSEVTGDIFSHTPATSLFTFGTTGTGTKFSVNASTGATVISGTLTPSQTNGIVGTTTNNSANAGSVGEFVTSTVATGASVTLATGVTSNVTSVSLTAGDWDCSGAVDFTFGATTSYTNLVGGVSTTTGTLGGQDTKFDFETPAAVPTAGADATFPLPIVRELLSGTTTVFLVAQGAFTVSTLKAYGTIRCRRVR